MLCRRRAMPPKRKTGVQNVDIGGAYKLDKMPETEQKKPQVCMELSVSCNSSTQRCCSSISASATRLSDVLSGQQNLKLCLLSWSVISQEEVMPTDHDAETHEEQEDVDAELEALAMECVGFCFLALL